MLKIGLIVCVAVGMLAGCQAVGGRSGSAKMERGVLLRAVNVGGAERKYAVYVPREYDAAQAWPVIVFLNGMGECGEDGQKQLAVGLMPAVLAQSAAWPFVIVCPQKPVARTQWIDHDDLVMATLAATMEEFKVDRERVYLTGLSQGGAGTWAIGSRHADVFAALVPICGYGTFSEAGAARLKGMPIWAFHGGKDDVVPVQKSQVLIEAVTAAGGSPRLTVFPNANHNSWDEAYRTQKLGEWFLKQRKVK